MISIMVKDSIMGEVESQCKTGIQWTLTIQLHDLDYTDDKCHLSQKLQHMQTTSDHPALGAEKMGLRISKEKTKVMTANSKQREIKLKDEELEDVQSFTYLGSIVTSDGGADEDVKSRIGKARQAFNTPRPVWNSTSISTKSKLRIFTTNVKSVLLQIWRVTRSISKKLQIFTYQCLRRIIKIYWPEKISDRELWARTKQDCIPVEIARCKWNWIGHTSRKPTYDTT